MTEKKIRFNPNDKPLAINGTFLEVSKVAKNCKERKSKEGKKK